MKMITIDLLIKILPVFLAVVPFLVWLDKSKRFMHRRKFYLNRLEAVKQYLDNYYNSDKINWRMIALHKHWCVLRKLDI